MEEIKSIKKEYTTPLLHSLEVGKTLGGDLNNPEDGFSQPAGTDGGSDA